MVFQTGDNVTWADDKPGDMKVIAAGLDWVHVQHQNENVDAYKQEQEVLKPEKLKAWSQEARDAALAARRAHMAREAPASNRPGASAEAVSRLASAARSAGSKPAIGGPKVVGTKIPGKREVIAANATHHVIYDPAFEGNDVHGKPMGGAYGVFENSGKPVSRHATADEAVAAHVHLAAAASVGRKPALDKRNVAARS